MSTREIHLLHDAAMLAQMIGLDAPCCSHVAMPSSGPAHAFAAFVESNPLSDGWLIDLEAPSSRLVTYSGTLGDELFGDEPRTWMRTGQERFIAFLDEVEPALHHHRRTLCFRPHHRHVVGDVHAAVKLLRDRAGGPFEILLSPADMLAPSMLETALDHATRMFAHLGSVVAAVLLTDIEVSENTGETGLFRTCRLGEGLLTRTLGDGVLARLLAEHVPPTTPVILLPGSVESQRALIGL